MYYFIVSEVSRNHQKTSLYGSSLKNGLKPSVFVF